MVSSQTVGEEIQTLLSVAVELVEDQETLVRKTHRQAGGSQELGTHWEEHLHCLPFPPPL